MSRFRQRQMCIRDRFEVGEVCANCLGRILRLVRLQELFLNLVPVIEVNSVVAERLPPDDGVFPEA